ncbi:Tetraspanin-18 [Hibiscus syriacus]|uniref:Tetraspanin-18 n=1 Tax=Hibiscus syriacus TaxID=106335 RepID=A0A6A2YDM2_HIBSY|nr:tetraspanin-18-like [Hibiscus syriacus]XP_039030852.1 tetraspanin-18-like [Hibiscus syriacus]KAE8676856.1 Tetraspanin-18 [Hibiscus syriacus]
MQTNCCHVSLAFFLKLLNSLQAFVGVSIVLYSIWMLDQWKHHVPISPPPLAPPPESSVSILFKSGPEIGAQADRVFDGLAVGLVSGLDNDVGLNLSSVELPAPWFIYSFMGIGILLCSITLIGCIAAESVNGCCLCFYTLLKIVLILIEAALVAFIAIDHRWEKDLPFDPTGELDSFRSFVEENIDICKWVGLGVVIIQALALLVAMILRSMVSARRRDIEEEDDYESVKGRTWEPLLNPQSSHSSTSAKGDGRGTQSNMWGSRIREKFGSQSGDKYNSLK